MRRVTDEKGERVTPWRKTVTFILWQPLSSTRGTTRDRGPTSAMSSHFPTDESWRRGHPSVTTQHHHFIFAILVIPCQHPGQHNGRGPSPITNPINHAMSQLFIGPMPRLHHAQKRESRARINSPKKSSRVGIPSSMGTMISHSKVRQAHTLAT